MKLKVLFLSVSLFVTPTAVATLHMQPEPNKVVLDFNEQKIIDEWEQAWSHGYKNYRNSLPDGSVYIFADTYEEGIQWMKDEFWRFFNYEKLTGYNQLDPSDIKLTFKKMDLVETRLDHPNYHGHWMNDSYNYMNTHWNDIPSSIGIRMEGTSTAKVIGTMEFVNTKFQRGMYRFIHIPESNWDWEKHKQEFFVPLIESTTKKWIGTYYYEGVIPKEGINPVPLIEEINGNIFLYLPDYLEKDFINDPVMNSVHNYYLKNNPKYPLGFEWIFKTHGSNWFETRWINNPTPEVSVRYYGSTDKKPELFKWELESYSDKKIHLIKSTRVPGFSMDANPWTGYGMDGLDLTIDLSGFPYEKEEGIPDEPVTTPPAPPKENSNILFHVLIWTSLSTIALTAGGYLFFKFRNK